MIDVAILQEMIKGYLLDTDLAVLYLTDYPAAPDKIKRIISDDELDKYVSVATIWEIAIVGAGDPNTLLTDDIAVRRLTECGIKILPVCSKHSADIQDFENVKSAINKILVAQATDRNLGILTCDGI